MNAQELQRFTEETVRRELVKSNSSGAAGVAKKLLEEHVAHERRMSKIHEVSNPELSAEHCRHADEILRIIGGGSTRSAAPSAKNATTGDVTDFWKRFYDDGDERGLAALKLEKAAAGNIFD